MPASGKSSKKQDRYMLIDGNALVHRGYHAIPALTTKTGEPTNAVYGFISILLRAIKDLKPTHVAATFDLAGPTFRHEQYLDYKATRVKADDELYQQIPRVKEVVRALNVPIFEMPGFEADDVLGTLATKICQQNKDNCQVMVVTGDLDTLQLVNDCVKIYTLRKGLTDIAIYDAVAVRERYGLEPSQMIDFKALRGDPSDNIKGVAGIGEKGAAELIKKFGSLDNLYKEVNDKGAKIKDKVKPRILELLKAGEQQARLSYELSKIICDLPLHVEIPRYEFTGVNLHTTTKLFQALEFKSLVEKLPKSYIGAASAAAAETSDESAAVKHLANPIGKQNYIFVSNPSQFKDFLAGLKQQKIFALDTETDRLDAIAPKFLGMSVSFSDSASYYILADLVLKSEELKRILQDPAIKKIGHNIKYDYLVLQHAGITVQGADFDTMIASYLLNPGTRQHSLDTLAFNDLGYQMQPISALIGKGKQQITMDQVPEEKVAWYAAEDADMTRRLKDVYEPELKKEQLEKIFQDIEMPLVPVLAAMEKQGIKLDLPLFKWLSQTAAKRLSAVEKEIYALAEEEFNLNSPKQMQEILFTKLGLVAGKKTKTGASTAAGELEKLRGSHPIVDKLLSYRELSKLQSTYLNALPLLVHPATGRLHTSYNQTVAATGRLSSTDPNLQNIPIRGTGLGAEIRKGFIADSGNKLLSLDYSQIELRVVAHLAQDQRMMEIFQHQEDIHTSTAKAIFGVKEEDITPDMRRDAKTINFGVLYGLSSFGFSSRIGEVSQREAKEFIEKYFAAYPQVEQYLEAIKAEVHEYGLVKNELGRIRRFPEIRSSQFFVRAAAERAAVNFPLQSLAADILKIAMINIHKEIAAANDIKMLLQVHDELVFEVREDRADYWAKKIQPLMENAYKLSVPLTVAAKVGDNWGEMV